MSESVEAVDELINQLARLPGVGEKTAARLAFFILDAPEELPRSLAAALVAVREKVRRCDVCGNLTERDRCRYCTSERRDGGVLCVVESVPDLMAIERTGEYRGRYHVLHGLIRPLDGVGPDDINLRSLVERAGTDEISEIIVATNPSAEGETTALYIRNLLTPLGLTVSRIASGIPLGGELEYADSATLGRALTGRRPL